MAEDDTHAVLGEEEPVAPPLLWSAVPSVLREIVFREEISQTLGGRALTRFLDGN